jgi:hypothetical protein
MNPFPAKAATVLPLISNTYCERGEATYKFPCASVTAPVGPGMSAVSGVAGAEYAPATVLIMFCPTARGASDKTKTGKQAARDQANRLRSKYKQAFRRYCGSATRNMGHTPELSRGVDLRGAVCQNTILHAAFATEMVESG